jgi:hypothetical protein
MGLTKKRNIKEIETKMEDSLVKKKDHSRMSAEECAMHKALKR